MNRPHYCLLFGFFLTTVTAFGQQYRLSGKVTTNRMEPLALATVKVKGLPLGTTTREDGTYELLLEEGSYDIAITMIGFKPQVITFHMRQHFVQNILLETDEHTNLSEVIVKGKAKDRSEEIIRMVIRHKEDILAAPGSWSSTVYIKATQEDSSARKKKKNAKPVDSLRLIQNLELQRMSMAEISLQYDQSSDGKIREERTGVSKRGNPGSLFYLSQTEGNFNLYNNLLKIPALSVVPFLSPVSYSGIAAYRFKMVSIKTVGTRKLYTISVKPRALSNVAIEGEITIMDSAWVLLDAHFVLPSFHVPEYDRFEVEQKYEYVQNKAWMITKQQFTYYAKNNKRKVSGQTTASYSNFELQKIFPRRHFGVELSATAQEAYDRDTAFWQKTRTEPLTPKEIRFIHYKDSIHRVVTSKPYLDSLDSITNKITWKKMLLTGQTFYNRDKEQLWHLPTIPSLYEPFQFGGARLRVSGFYTRAYKSKKNIGISADLSYGFRNKDVNGGLSFRKMYNPFNRGFYNIGISRDFQYIYEGDAWINMIKRNNFYLNNSINLGHGLELANGLFLYTDLDFALRRSLAGYKTNDKVDSLFGDVLEDNQAIGFDPYNALYTKIRLQYTPGQRYIREPREKIILGSKFPTFYINYRKGVPGVFSSKVDFDYLEYGIEQELKLGITGVSKYTIKSGSFLSRKDLRLVDYQFQRRGDPWLFMNPQEAFQSLDSTFPLFKRFYQAHYLHEFNGAILNKIPFLKKLQLKEIAGGGFLVAPERNLRYFEAFIGVEKVFKWPFDPRAKLKMGIYLIGSGSNQFRNPLQFKIGFTSWDKRRQKWI